MKFSQLILTSLDLISTKCANNALSWFLECQIDFMSVDLVFDLLRTLFLNKKNKLIIKNDRKSLLICLEYFGFILSSSYYSCPVSPCPLACLLVSLRMAGHNFMNFTFVAQILTLLLFVHRFVFCRLAYFYALSLSLHFMFHIYQKLSLRSLLISDILGVLWWAEHLHSSWNHRTNIKNPSDDPMIAKYWKSLVIP